MEFSRQEYWGKFPFPDSGDLPNPGIEPTSLVSPYMEALVGFSHVFGLYGLNVTLLSQGRVLEMAPLREQWAECVFQGKELGQGDSYCPDPASGSISSHVLWINSSNRSN